jgi:hypothetical protein
MKLAIEKFPERLVCVIKVYGGNIEDFAAVETLSGNYDLWKYNPKIDDWEREKNFIFLTGLTNYLGSLIWDNYLSKKEMETLR